MLLLYLINQQNFASSVSERAEDQRCRDDGKEKQIEYDEDDENGVVGGVLPDRNQLIVGVGVIGRDDVD